MPEITASGVSTSWTSEPRIVGSVRFQWESICTNLLSICEFSLNLHQVKNGQHSVGAFLESIANSKIHVQSCSRWAHI